MHTTCPRFYKSRLSPGADRPANRLDSAQGPEPRTRLHGAATMLRVCHGIWMTSDDERKGIERLFHRLMVARLRPGKENGGVFGTGSNLMENTRLRRQALRRTRYLQAGESYGFPKRRRAPAAPSVMSLLNYTPSFRSRTSARTESGADRWERHAWRQFSRTSRHSTALYKMD
jgi:hypothetical protein